MGTLPAELQGLLDQIDACERDAESLLAGLDDDGVNWHPAPGRWSIAQCLQHLAVMNDVYTAGCDDHLREARVANVGSFNGLHPTIVGRWFANSMEPPARIKLKAPSPTTPGPSFPRDGLLTAYTLSHTRYRAIVRDSADVDINRVVFPNRFIGAVKMRLSTVLMIIPAHDRRHLYQAREVRKALRNE
jgi:DinB family protein